jgi:hypothetical protein
MFVRKTTLTVAIIGCAVSDCSCFAEGQGESIKQLKHYEEYKGMLLDSSEILGFNKQLELSTSWFRGRGKEDEPITVKGFIQEFDTQDRSVFTIVKYGRFADVDAAKDAMARHVENVAAIFQSEAWANAHLKHTPDEILFSDGGGSCGILFQYNRTCILVGVGLPLNDPFFDLGIDGGPVVGAVNVNLDLHGQVETHITIDDNPTVLNGIRSVLLQRVSK